MTRLSFVSAVGPYHAHLIGAVRAEVGNQTVKCQHVVVEDTDGRGPGWARNAGLTRVETDFVAFLDADDQLAPTWAEETIAAFRREGGRRYIYTDHVRDNQIVLAPECAWVNRTWHVVTALIPTEWVRRVGGFDETMPAFEDTAFYLKLNAYGFCGKRLARPLFTYGANGQRSSRYHATPVEDAAMRYFSKQYGGRTVGCCGDVTPNIPPSGDRQEGDVLAMAIYGGNRRELGRVTGRLYPRVGNGARLWMDARDIAASPALWRAVSEPETNTTAPDFDFTSFADYAQQTGDDGGPLASVEEIAAFFMQTTVPPAEYEPPPAAISVEAAVPPADKPSAATLRKKAAAGRARGRSQRPGAVAS